jgi:hypothetical protein
LAASGSSATTFPREISNFGQNAQHGSLLQLSYTQQDGSTQERYNNFRNVISNPCHQG